MQMSLHQLAAKANSVYNANHLQYKTKMSTHFCLQILSSHSLKMSFELWKPEESDAFAKAASKSSNSIS